MRWFDFAESNAKLERVRKGPGHHALVLEVDTENPVLENLRPEDLETYGWIALDVSNGRMLFENHRSILRASDVAQSLMLFFSEEHIRDAHRPVDDLIQGERVEGLKTREMATLKDFENDMSGVDPANMSRIMASIQNAQTKVQEAQRKSAAQLLEGRGIHIAETLAPFVGPERAVAALIDVSRDHKNPGLEELLNDFADCGVDDRAGLADNISSLVSQNSIGFVARRMADFNAIDKVMTNGKGSPFDAALGAVRSVVPVLALEEMKHSELSTEELESKIGMSIRRDKSLPTAQYRHALLGMAECMEAIGDALNKEPAKIVPAQDGVVLRIARKSAMADERTLGVRVSVQVDADADDEVQSVSAITVSATYGGAFAHEMGHLIEQGYNITDDERREVLETSGVRGRVFRAVRAAADDDKLTPKLADYYRSDTEIWARTFEAAILNRSLLSGDYKLQGVGGYSAGVPGDDFSPIGDNELTEKFLSEVNILLDQKMNLQHQKRQAASASVEP